MRVLYRTDASTSIGTGHLRRCLTVANRLRPFAWEQIFLCRDLSSPHENEILANNFKIINLPKLRLRSSDDFEHSDYCDCKKTFERYHINCLIVDHYGLSYVWEQLASKHVEIILTIDDLALHSHYCDALLNPNIMPSLDQLYSNLINPESKTFFGPSYLPLRDEFLEHKKNLSITKNNYTKNILIYFGGTDPSDSTLEALELIVEFLTSDQLASYSIKVIAGINHRSNAKLIGICKAYSFELYTEVTNIAEYMAWADISLGAGGISTYERLFMGLPSILKPTVKNQVKPLEYMHSLGLFEIYNDKASLARLLYLFRTNANVAAYIYR